MPRSRIVMPRHDLRGLPSARSLHQAKLTREPDGKDMDSANQDPERSQKTKLATIHKKRLLVFALLALTVITTVLIATVITAAAWFIRWLENGWSETRFWELTAYLATTVGAAGTIFSAIAVLCAIYSVHLQSKELALQRAEMARSREELAKSAVAQLQSSNAMLSHAQIGALRSLAEHERHLHTTARKESEKHRAGGREKAYETLLESTYTIMSSPTTQNPTLKSAIHRQALCFGAVMSAAVEFESLNQTTKNKTGNQKALADGANHCLSLIHI